MRLAGEFTLSAAPPVQPNQANTMCLALPARILSIDATADMATVAIGAVSKQVSLALVDAATVGDYVLVHVGYALGRISPEEAARTLHLIAEALGAGETPPEAAMPFPESLELLTETRRHGEEN